MPEPIDFYFELASPYGYLASLRIDAIAARHGRAVRWLPIMLGAALKRMGTLPNVTVPMKGDYLRHDVARTARLQGAPLRLPPVMPMNSLAASRAHWWLADDDPALARKLAQAVFHAHWGEGRDMSMPEQVAEVAGPLGIAAAELLAAVADPAIKERLRAETERSLDRGVFGSPFVIVDGEPFWGNDRLAEVERWLATGGW
jgi:2-hydroxychromene-2-carboxylate isomerase